MTRSLIPCAFLLLLTASIPAKAQTQVSQSFAVTPSVATPGGKVRVVKTVTSKDYCLEYLSDAALATATSREKPLLIVISTEPADPAIKCGGNFTPSITCGSSIKLTNFTITYEILVPSDATGVLVLTDAVYLGTCQNVDHVDIPLVSGPYLTIRKLVPDPRQSYAYRDTIDANDYFEYYISVTNNGNASTDKDIPTTVRDPIPSGVSVVEIETGIPGECTKSGREVLCTHTPVIPPGGVWGIRFVMFCGSLEAGPITNTAVVNGGGDTTNPKDSSVVVVNEVRKKPFTCQNDAKALCLWLFGAPLPFSRLETLAAPASRFEVRVYWRALYQGTSGQGQAVPLTSDTGYFWFFSPNNVELVVKVVDGRAVNGKFWVFYGALTNIEYIIEIADSVTGAVQGYFNPQDTQASNADTGAFSPAATTALPEGEFEFIPLDKSADAGRHPVPASQELIPEVVSAACVTDATTQCLNGGRFQVRVRWDALHLGTSGEGQAVPITSDTGYFWFFSANNIELVIKVVDGRPVNGKFWVFYGALTNVQYTITITDTLTGAVKVYFNPQDTQASASDTSAF